MSLCCREGTLSASFSLSLRRTSVDILLLHMAEIDRAIIGIPIHSISTPAYQQLHQDGLHDEENTIIRKPPPFHNLETEHWIQLNYLLPSMPFPPSIRPICVPHLLSKHHSLTIQQLHLLIYLPPVAAAPPAASVARFCCMAWCSAKRRPTRCVILRNRAAQFSAQAISDLSRLLDRNEETHEWKHRSTNRVYILRRCRNQEAKISSHPTHQQ